MSAFRTVGLGVPCRHHVQASPNKEARFPHVILLISWSMHRGLAQFNINKDKNYSPRVPIVLQVPVQVSQF